MTKQVVRSGWILAALALVCTGCLFPKTGRYSVRVHRDAELQDVAIQVDVLGIAQEDRNTWASGDVNKYWSQVLDGHRDPSAIALQFSPGQQQDEVLQASKKTENDLKYKELLDTKHPWYLVVISDYPSSLEGKDAGANDPRRCIIPLARKEYGTFTRQIRVDVQKAGIRIATQ